MLHKLLQNRENTNKINVKNPRLTVIQGKSATSSNHIISLLNQTLRSLLAVYANVRLCSNIA